MGKNIFCKLLDCLVLYFFWVVKVKPQLTFLVLYFCFLCFLWDSKKTYWGLVGWDGFFLSGGEQKSIGLTLCKSLFYPLGREKISHWFSYWGDDFLHWDEKTFPFRAIFLLGMGERGQISVARHIIWMCESFFCIII